MVHPIRLPCKRDKRIWACAIKRSSFWNYLAMNNTYVAVVLAAGKGTRMRSNLPKVLHQVAGLPLMAHVLNALDDIPTAAAFVELRATLESHRPVVVVGYGAEHVAALFGQRCHYALQEEQLGTGHAVLMVREEVEALQPV